MKKLYLTISTLFALSLFFVEYLHAGAWGREEGEVYSKFFIQQFSSDQIYDSKKSKKLPGPDYDETTTGLYGEYGLTKKWTGILSLAHKSIDYKTPAIDTHVSGVTDLWGYAKRTVLEAPFVFSGQMGVKIPLGYHETNVPPLGDGQVDIEGRILLGKSFYPFPGYGNVEVGYRKRNGAYSDEIPYLIEAGAQPMKPILVKLVLSGITNQTNDDASRIGFTSTNPNIFDKEYMKLSPSVVVFLKSGFSMEAYYETYLSGANTALGDTLGIGVSWQGKLIKPKR